MHNYNKFKSYLINNIANTIKIELVNNNANIDNITILVLLHINFANQKQGSKNILYPENN